MDLSAELQAELLKIIVALRATISQDIGQSTKDELSRYENLLTLDELETSLQSSSPTAALIASLATRWQRIRRSFMAYNEQPFNAVNGLCVKIAQSLSPLPSDDSIDEVGAEGPYLLLMPSLMAWQDVYGNSIHRLALHEFILSDDQTRYIPLEICCQSACVSEEGYWRHVATTKDNHYPLLTSNEKKRLRVHSSLLTGYVDAIDVYHQQQKYGSDLGAYLHRLKLALTTGGVHDQGREYDAGSAANEGILVFHLYWSKLDQRERDAYLEKYPELNTITGNLLNPVAYDYRNIIYCVELIALNIDTLIRRYTLGTKTGAELFAEVEAWKNLCQSAFSNLDKPYPISLSEASSPRILHLIHRLDRERQSAFFRYDKSTSAWIYALHYEPAAILDFGDVDAEKKEEAISACFEGGLTPLMLAVCAGELKSVHYLIRLGVNQNAKDAEGKTAFQWALERGNNVMIAALFTEDLTIEHADRQGNTYLHVAISNKRFFMVDGLLAKAVDFKKRNRMGCNALDFALLADFPDCLKLLLVQAGKLTLLQQMELLTNIDGGKYQHALNYAAHRGFIDTLSALFANGMAVDTPDCLGNTALCWAVNAGHIDTIKHLLKNGANVNHIGHEAYTPLHWAVMHGHAAVAELLLSRGALLTLRNRYQNNAFDIASKRYTSIIPVLLKQAVLLSPEQQAEFLSALSPAYPTIEMYLCMERVSLLSKILPGYWSEPQAKDVERARAFLKTIDFEKHVDAIQKKWREMREKAKLDPHYKEAAQVIQTLVFRLAHIKARALHPTTTPGEIEEFAFKTACLDALHEAKTVLATPRNKKKQAVKSIVSVISLGFFSTKTDSAALLDKFELSLHCVNAASSQAIA
jgi:ankyrin repeat protein